MKAILEFDMETDGDKYRRMMNYQHNEELLHELTEKVAKWRINGHKFASADDVIFDLYQLLCIGKKPASFTDESHT